MHFEEPTMISGTDFSFTRFTYLLVYLSVLLVCFLFCFLFFVLFFFLWKSKVSTIFLIKLAFHNLESCIVSLVLIKSISTTLIYILFEPADDQTNKMNCAPSEDSDQPGHPPSLIRVFAVRMKKPWVLSYQLSAQRKL